MVQSRSLLDPDCGFVFAGAQAEDNQEKGKTTRTHRWSIRCLTWCGWAAPPCCVAHRCNSTTTGGASSSRLLGCAPIAWLGFLRLHRSVRSTHRELAAHRPGEAGWNHARISRAEPAPRSTGPSLPGGQVESELTRRILVTREVLTTWGYKNSSCSCFSCAA